MPWPDPSHVIICSKFTIETLEQGVKYVQQRHQGVVLVSLSLTLKLFHILVDYFYC